MYYSTYHDAQGWYAEIWSAVNGNVLHRIDCHARQAAAQQEARQWIARNKDVKDTTMITGYVPPHEPLPQQTEKEE